jgi:uncharacterized protein (TIGR00290 family)
MGYAVLWSGGKDSCFAYYKAMLQGYHIRCLVILVKKGNRLSLSHFRKDKIIQSQAEALGVFLLQKEIIRYNIPPIQYRISSIFSSQGKFSRYARNIIRNVFFQLRAVLRKTTKTSIAILMHSVIGKYNKQFQKIVRSLALDGVEGVISGDFEPTGQKEFFDRICKKEGIELITPLCEQDREKTVRDFINAGFEAIVVVVNLSFLGKEHLGRKVDKEFFDFLAKNNLDLSGENGEYHTLVTDGPIFKKRIKIIKSKIVTVGIDAYLDILKYSLI